MSEPLLAYKVVRGVMFPDEQFGISPNPDIVKVKIGRQLPFGRMFVCPDKQRCIDYYAGTNTFNSDRKDEHEYVLTLDCTGMEVDRGAVNKESPIPEILVAMPYLVAIEPIDCVNMAKLRACPGCPFAKSCIPGELGGSPIEKYLGQIIGPFFLPCHEVAGYEGNASRLHTCKRQCVGASVMRSNIGVAQYMPAPLLKLPAHHDKNVLPNLDAFIAHHEPQLSAAERADMLSKIEHYLVHELKHPNARREHV